MWRPVDIAPDSRIVLSKNARISAHQRERAHGAGVAAGAGAHRDQPVDAGRRRLLGVAHVDHVVEDEAAVAVHRVDHLLDGAERGDHQRHLVLRP